MQQSFEFWDALAPYHSTIENSYLDVQVLRGIIGRIHDPVLVVGAGQGLIISELHRRGLRSQGVDSSSEMIRYAKLRRDLSLIRADAQVLPFEQGDFSTILYATGVVDFMTDDEEIRAVIQEGRRVAGTSGQILIAFCRFSAATEELLKTLGLLKNSIFRLKETLEIYRLTPLAAVAWASRRAQVGRGRAAWLMLRSWARSTWQEKRNAFRMKKIFAASGQADSLIQTAPEQQAYRTEVEIRSLFARLNIPIQELQPFSSCHMVQIGGSL